MPVPLKNSPNGFSIVFVPDGLLTLFIVISYKDAIGMNAIERMRIVRNLPLNMDHKDSTSFTTEMCFVYISINNLHVTLS